MVPILLITRLDIDAIRECYEYHKRVMPLLERTAAAGIVYARKSIPVFKAAEVSLRNLVEAENENNIDSESLSFINYWAEHKLNSTLEINLKAIEADVAILEMMEKKAQ